MAITNLKDKNKNRATKALSIEGVFYYIKQEGDGIGNEKACIPGVIGAVVSYMFELMGVAVTILMLFMLAYYITGLVAAGINRELNSRIGWQGFVPKSEMIL